MDSHQVHRRLVIGARFAHALECRSRCVMMAGCGPSRDIRPICTPSGFAASVTGRAQIRQSGAVLWRALLTRRDAELCDGAPVASMCGHEVRLDGDSLTGAGQPDRWHCHRAIRRDPSFESCLQYIFRPRRRAGKPVGKPGQPPPLASNTSPAFAASPRHAGRLQPAPGSRQPALAVPVPGVRARARGLCARSWWLAEEEAGG